MKTLAVQQVLFIQARLIEEKDGGHGVRDLGLMQSALARPRATFEGSDLYPGSFSNTAALIESIIRDCPFVDGDKRTGIASAAILLRLNSCRLSATNQEVEAFTLKVAKREVDLGRITEWFMSNSEPASD